jgi:hypothetical protein
MPWTNSYGHPLHPPETPFTEHGGKLTMNGRYFNLAMFTRTGRGTGIVNQVGNGLKASGTHTGNAAMLTNDWNQFTDVAAGSGCNLPTLKPGQDVQVVNNGANDLNCYPVGQLIDALDLNAPYVLAPGKMRTFQCITTGALVSWGN